MAEKLDRQAGESGLSGIPGTTDARPQSGFSSTSASSSGTYGFFSLTNLLRRRWLLICLVALVTAIVIGSLGFTLPPRYAAEAFIRIDPSSKSVLDISAAYGRPPDAGYVETEVNEIVSRPVAEAVVRRLNLQHSDEFRRSPFSFQASFWNGGGPYGNGAIRRYSRCRLEKPTGHSRRNFLQSSR